tara:strand:- start:180 stop:629 length:450 start_codon:yes stop_codon:yes gene_type:complete
MKKILVLTVGAYVLAIARTATAVPVVPNFTQGAMTSTTETTSTVTETINSMNYDTGYQYIITGTNVQMDGTSLSPTANITTENTIEGVTSTWTGLDLSTKPNFTISTPNGVGSFQFTESYSGPGLKTQTIIQRTTQIQSVTNTTSQFSN